MGHPSGEETDALQLLCLLNGLLGLAPLSDVPHYLRKPTQPALLIPESRQNPAGEEPLAIVAQVPSLVFRLPLTACRLQLDFRLSSCAIFGGEDDCRAL